MAMDKQMELFEDGGLKDEGGMIDEESGNEVPVGSTREEVRDDIPAQLSEGEFVLPADVVRYHGLDKIMALRDEAKAGLQKMEAMGQMGNSDEAILPDDVPFDIEDMDMEDDGMDYAVGGYVPPPQVQIPGVTYQQSQFAGYQPQYQGYQQPTVQQQPITAYQAPQQQYTPTMTGATGSGVGVPTFAQPTMVTYYDANGNTIQIPVDANGNPLIPVPSGFSKTKPQAQQTATATTGAGTGVGTAGITTTSEDSGISQADLQQQKEYFATVEKRQAAAEELGYTKKQSAIEPLMAALVPGGSMFMKPEKGTVLVDGTIADGEGNSFDPITGEQVQYAGGMLGAIAAGLTGKKEDVSKAASDMGVSPGSMAGLKTVKGEESIKDLLDSLPEKPESTKVESAGVETTLETQEGKVSATATEALNRRISDITTLSGGKINTYRDILDATLGGNVIFEERGRFRNLPNGKVDSERQTAIGVFGVDGSKAYVYNDGQVEITSVGSSGRSRDDIRADALSSAKAVRVEKEQASDLRSGYPTRGESMQSRYDAQASKYESQGYSPSAAAEAARNKVQADDEAKAQTGNPNATAVTSRDGTAVRSARDNSVVTSGSSRYESSEDSGGGSSSYSSSSSNDAYSGASSDFTSSGGWGGGGIGAPGLAKGGLAKQMEKSGLTPKK